MDSQSSQLLFSSYSLGQSMTNFSAPSPYGSNCSFVSSTQSDKDLSHLNINGPSGFCFGSDLCLPQYRKKDELKTFMNSPSSLSSQSTSMSSGRSSPGEKFVFISNEMKYKTELCKNWTTYGKCAYGSRCRFAHGKDDLRVKQYVTPSYRTKKCQAYFGNGYCPYGHRCHFIHEHTDFKELNRRFYHYLLQFPKVKEVYESQYPKRRLRVFKSMTDDQKVEVDYRN